MYNNNIDVQIPCSIQSMFILNVLAVVGRIIDNKEPGYRDILYGCARHVLLHVAFLCLHEYMACKVARARAIHPSNP